MHPDLLKLLELQRTDTEILRLKREIAALPVRVAEIEAKLADDLAKVEKAKTDAKANEQNRRKFEGEIQNVQQKISKYRDQMLAVKTNDEYRALGHEIKFAEDAIRGFEDKILECMVSAEELEKNINAVEKSLAAERVDVEAEKNQARLRTSEDEAAVKALEPKQAELRSGIDEDLLRQYDRVLKSRGTAISEARDHKCLACNVMLRPQVYSDIRDGNRVLTCDSCGRILYYDQSRDAEVAEQKSATPSQDTTA
jgi:uncharacterized protein